MLPEPLSLASTAERQKFKWQSGKVFPHSIGLSVAFRQWRAESHCHFLHGYAIQVSLTFSTSHLDQRNWVVDFGSLKGFKGWLEKMFDHTTLVAEDDPELHFFEEMHNRGLIQLRVVPHCGMEALAYYIYQYAELWLTNNGYQNVMVDEVEVREHDSNFARFGRV